LHTRLLLPLPTGDFSLPFLQRRLLRLFTPLLLRRLDLLPLGRPRFLRRPLFFLHTRLLLPLPTGDFSLPFLQRRLLRLFTPLRLRRPLFFLHTRLLLPLPTGDFSLPFLQRRLLRLFTPLLLRVECFMLFIIHNILFFYFFYYNFLKRKNYNKKNKILSCFQNYFRIDVYYHNLFSLVYKIPQITIVVS
jgi:hypothetical protein